MSGGGADTIFALASAQGKAGVSVVRVSGPDAFGLCRELAGDVPVLRKASLRKLRSAVSGFIDEALVLAFEENGSFTGEQSVEFQVHGSIAIVRSLLVELARLGARHAEPGEFTRRALENGQLDLAQVEALGDLIESETEAQRKQALRVFDGNLGQKIEEWRALLIRAAALLEVSIDFADEEIPEDVSPEVTQILSTVKISVDQELNGFDAAEKIRTGFEVAILGAPNAGKSTLLNALAGRDAAIVSEIAGTTRDVIEVRMDIKGLSVTLLDTAGVRTTEDKIEALGVQRALERALAADLRVFLGGIDDQLLGVAKDQDIFIEGKADLVEGSSGVSGLTGQGVSELLDRIFVSLQDKTAGAGLVTRERHRVSLAFAVEALVTASERVAFGPDYFDLAAEDVRIAIRSMESLVGRVDVEAVLDEIFSSFCLGK